MKLSEAIREGAKKRPQCFGNLFDFIFDPKRPGHHVIGSCVLGAAMEGAGVCDPDADDDPDTLDFGVSTLSHFDGFESIDVRRLLYYCPEGCVDDPSRIDSMGMHLNDDHQWTRERIATWVEELGY